MKILALDSSGLTASVAVIEDENLMGEYTMNYKKTHSQTLMPMISEMMSMADVKPEELDAIAVSEGPGSFTGLRIGASIAKGLAWTLKIPIVPVSSLMGLAECRDAGTDCLPDHGCKKKSSLHGSIPNHTGNTGAA